MADNYLYISESHDGYYNLGLDEWFLDNIGDDDLVLYFYINRNAIIIGKNQNPHKECDLEKMKADGVQLVRRISGGGAVYHDCGNLNFSFIAGKNRFNKDRQLNFIMNCIRCLGIDCCFSGRNDLLAEGHKFSGNAYCTKGHAKQHHGTLLINSNLDKLQKYLTVDERKIRAKGVDSVRSRVCNLSELRHDVTPSLLLSVIRQQFSKDYGDYSYFTLTNKQKSEVDEYREKASSKEWIFSKVSKFDYVFDNRFSFGSVQILLSIENDEIQSVQVFTDSMDTELPQKLQSRLIGLTFDKKTVIDALSSEGSSVFIDISDKFAEAF
ncbi:MAG: lipoate--protein ligase [Ruminococcaceae bacterium]|nr:lipoate--protein ligase [Oscillospiraceae bacterium]